MKKLKKALAGLLCLTLCLMLLPVGGAAANYGAHAEEAYLTARLGETVTLHVIAESDQEISYQWYTTAWVATDWGGYAEKDRPIEDETAAEMKVTVDGPVDYICDVDLGPFSWEVNFQIAVENGLWAGAEDGKNNIHVPEGEKAVLKVVGGADVGALSYCWFFWDGESDTMLALKDETGDSITTAEIYSAQSYDCLVTDIYGNETWVSFNVSVEDGFTLVPVGDYGQHDEPHVPGVWTEYSVTVYDVAARVGDTVTLEGVASSDSGKDISYQWGCLTDPYFGSLEGETGAKLTLQNVQDSRHYALTATNTYGETLAIYFLVTVENEGTQGVPIDKEHFPDDAFRAYVKNHFDGDDDGTLSQSEIMNATTVEIHGTEVTSFRGIEYLTELTDLNSWTDWEEAPLQEIDLSKNTKLQNLCLFYTQLTELDVTMLPELKSLIVAFTKLSELDLTQNPELEFLLVDDCAFTSLDLSGNPKLSHLDVCGNPMEELDISPCPSLVADYKAGGRQLEKFKDIDSELYERVRVYGGAGDEEYNLAVDVTMKIICEKSSSGDANGDGKVNGKDAILLAQFLAGWDVELAPGVGDVNGDGKINGKDAILLAQFLAGWDVELK